MRFVRLLAHLLALLRQLRVAKLSSMKSAVFTALSQKDGNMTNVLAEVSLP